MRVMTYNIEWFDNLFNSDNTLKKSVKETERFSAIAAVIKATNADVIGITEGPNTTTSTGERSTVQALENFAKDYNLRQSKALIGFPSAGNQEIALLYDPAVLEASHDPGGSEHSINNPRFNKQFQVDTNGDGIKELYKHYRPPLEAKLTRVDNNESFWVIVAHAKSKGIFSAMDRVHFDRTSERNRRKLFAECQSIRQRVDEWQELNRNIIVMGDINDGPGFDYYESKFGKSAVELIIGDIYNRQSLLEYYLGRPKFKQYGWEPSSTRFTDRYTGDLINALIDHIIVSPTFNVNESEQPIKIWNPYQLEVARTIKDQLLLASDHFPVTFDFQ